MTKTPPTPRELELRKKLDLAKALLLRQQRIIREMEAVMRVAVEGLRLAGLDAQAKAVTDDFLIAKRKLREEAQA